MRLVETCPTVSVPNVAAHIMIVEDDPIVREIVATSLRAEGFAVTEAVSSMDARDRFAAMPAQLVIIDIRLPDGSGHDLATALRAAGDPAVIFMTSLGGREDRIRGLDMGDDYLVKPIDVRELGARVRAVLRRYRRSQPAGALIELDGWTLDLVRRELADAGGEIVKLTRAEFDLLAALVQAGGVVLSRDYLLEVIASADSASSARTVDVLVSRIRRKVAGGLAERIRTIPGAGYRWTRLP